MSVALVLGMAQCKKNNDVITSGVTGDGTRTITLKVNDNGSKISVNPNTGAVGFTKGDVIYAAYNGRYAGKLTHDGTDFTGTVTTSGSDGAKLTFYFMGNKTPSGSLTTGASGTQALTVSIFDQTENYPVISVGLSNEDYASGTDTYTATLNNQCALVKFDVTTSSAYAPTIIAGVKDQVSVTFAAGAIGSYTYSQYRGAVKVAGGSGDRWAILLPQDAAGMGVAYSGDLCYNGTHGMIPAITENGYLTAGVNVNVSSALEGFSVASGTKVHFAPGNLQYLGTGTSGALTPKWRFADNQYDYMGNGYGTGSNNGNVSISGYSTYNTGSNEETPTTADMQAARDLLGWGSSGGGSIVTYPYNTKSDNGSIYGGTSDIAGTDMDWGVYLSKSNAIQNGYGKSWRTLTNTEHGYLLSSGRTDAASKRGLGEVGTYQGLVILPDDWTLPAGCSFSATTANYTTNVYSLAQWTLMEANGAVFLPAAGYRNGSSVYRAGSGGLYWSSSVYSSNADSAYRVYFRSGDFDPQDGNYRYYGYSVRLVF